MSDLSTRTALVVDTGGAFIPVAQRLARDFGQVFYTSEWREGFPTIARAVIGDGFANVTRVADPLAVLDQIDLAVFPDVSHPELQAHLRSLDIPVWGCGQGCELELSRPLWLRTLKECGLDVPAHIVVEGLEELEANLIDTDDCYVKLSRYRGTMETHHWRGFALDSDWLYSLRLRLGPAGEAVRFVVCDAIDNAIELGIDTYNIDGKWPSLLLHGVEAKDKGYLGAVTSWADLPDAIEPVLEALVPVLERLRYRSWVSIEARVTKDACYPIDFTARAGLPSISSQMELWENFSEIVWAGARGELIEPVSVAQSSLEALLSLKGEPGAWSQVVLPESLRQWAKLGSCCQIDGRHCFPPEPGGHDDAVGWLVSLGAGPGEALAALKERVALLPDGLSASLEGVAGAIAEARAEEARGIEFTEEPLPRPGSAVEETA